MEQLIKNIQNVFTQFDNFNFVIDTKRKKVLDFDFEEMNLLFYDEVKQIERHLQSFYLQGNDKILQRVKLELLRIENTLENMDFGVLIQYSKYNFSVTIEPEIIAKVNLLKIRYIKEIITYIETILLPPQTETKTVKLKVNQIALIHVYEGIQITRENAVEIAAKNGYTAKNSGEGLFQDYTNYCSTGNRKGKPTPCTPKKLKNKIELFESIVNHLSDSNKQRAIDEIQILKTIFENEYQ